MRPSAMALQAAVPIAVGCATGSASGTVPVATLVGGVSIGPSPEPLRVAGCTVTPRPPEPRGGLVAAMAGVRCAADASRRIVTIELWQLAGDGIWRPVAETDETYATSPGFGAAWRPARPRRSLPLGPDEISCRAAAPGVVHNYRTYAAAFGAAGEPLFHAGDEASLPRDFLGRMDALHAVALGIPTGSALRVRMPAADFLHRDPVWPAFLLSPKPVVHGDCSVAPSAPAP